MSAVAAAPPQADVGSPEARAARLYERHNRAIYGLCVKQLRSRDDADDAVQTTFIYALLSLRRGVVPQLELPWLYTIARNVCSTRRRSGSRRGAYEAPHDLDSIQDRLASPDRSDVATSDDFRSALSAIPENQRRALLLREWRGLSYDEIGAELGLSQAATEALLFRARQNVAQRLGAGVKALQGAPLITFIRNLFQTAAAKTIAVGAGAALTIAVIPAAQPQRSDVSIPRAAVVHVHGDVGSPTSTPRRPAGIVQTPTPRPAPASVPAGASQAPPVTPAASDAGAPPPAVSHEPTAVSPSTSAAPSPVAEAVDDVGTVVDDTVKTVEQTVELPAVSLPTVTTPTLPLPVQVPSVDLLSNVLP
jgi:RNA polymerase sigma-70 factor (ECF subfamily)